MLSALQRCAGVLLCAVMLLPGQRSLAAGWEPGGGSADTASGNASCNGVTEGSCPAPRAGTDAGQAPAGIAPKTGAGNPISLLTGNKRQVEVDVAIPGAELGFRRVYNSRNAEHNIGLGMGWHHTYSVSLFDAGNGAREIVQSDGRRLHFEPDGVDEDGHERYRANAPNLGLLRQIDGQHQWHLPDGRTLHFTGAYLILIDWPDQRRLELFYRYRKLSTVTDETGRVLRFDYTPGNGMLNGYDQERFRAQPSHLAQVTLPDGSTIGYDYDNRRNLTRVRFADGTSRDYHYENPTWPSHLTGLTDRTGVRFASWRYDREGRAVSSAHAGGVEKVTFAHPAAKDAASGAVVQTRITNSLGQDSTYTWQQPTPEAQPQLLSSIGPGCATCPPTGMEYTYDAAGRLLSAVRTGQGNAAGSGQTTDYAYDAQGRLAEIRQFDPSGQSRLVERREYAGDSQNPVRTHYPSVNPGGEHSVEIERNEAGLPVTVIERGWSPESVNGTADTPVQYQPIERITRRTYRDGRLVSVDGPRDDVADVIELEWDERNRPVSIRTPGAPALHLTGFDAVGRVTRFAEGAQSPVSLAYGPAHRVVRVEQRGRVITFDYDAEGRLTRFTDPDGATSRLRYDKAGTLTSLEDGTGRRTRFESDSEGRRTGSVALGTDGAIIRSIDTLFDALGRVARTRTETIGANGNASVQTLERRYDEAGRLASVSDAASGQRVGLDYAAFGALARVSEPGTGRLDDGRLGERQTGFDFDAAGNERALIDARGNRTQYLKDDFGRVVTHRSPDTGTTHYRYDAADNRIEKRDADGTVIQYSWDAASRLVGKVRPDGRFTYTYDPGHGQLIESVAPGTTELFAFDIEARLIRHERQIDDERFVTAYRYDENGRLSHKTLPDGQRLRYHYRDEAAAGGERGTLRAITRESLFGLRQETLVEAIDQDASDGTTGHTAGNGLRTISTFAPDGTIVSLDIDRVMNLDYEYDSAGRIVGIDVNGTLQRYAWSREGLSVAQTDGGVYRFEYDKAGNRRGRSIERPDGTVEATTYDYPPAGAGNRLLETNTLADDGDGTRQPALTQSAIDYTAAGAPLQARASLTYDYDSEQRPVRVFDADTLLAEYTYNGFGERIKKVTYRGDQKRITYFLYDGHQLTAQIDADSGELRQGVFLDEAPVTYLIGTAVHAVHSDHLGTPRLVTDNAGETLWSADYSPFGEASITTDTLDLPYRFPGQYFDAETGTHYNYYRDYDPATGRYLTPDPVGLQGGLNLQGYALNDPLRHTDVLGLAMGPVGPRPAQPASTPAKPGVVQSEQSYADKLTKVLNYAIQELHGSGQAQATAFLQTLVENIAVVAGVVVALAAAHAAGVGVAADAVLLAGGWMLAGYAAGKFLYDTILMGMRLGDTDLCDEVALQAMGAQFAGSIGELGQALAESVLLGALGKLSNALSSAADFAGDGMWTLWRKLKRLFGEDDIVAGLCSFAGDTLVSTREGYRPIRDIEAGRDEVWAREEHTGQSGWRAVLAQYHNRYEDAVKVTAVDADGDRQTITSNRIHPYFARIAAGALLATSSVTAMATEGHLYDGEIDGGAWVDAQHLEEGDQLLSADNAWQTIESVEIDKVPLEAYNLTVDEYATYFVAGDADAEAVLVHNVCFNTLPDRFKPTGEETKYGQAIYRDTDGNELYEGHNGRFYDPVDHPPSANGVDGAEGESDRPEGEESGNRPDVDEPEGENELDGSQAEPDKPENENGDDKPDADEPEGDNSEDRPEVDETESDNDQDGQDSEGPESDNGQINSSGGTGAAFGSPAKLEDHFNRHGDDFGAQSAQEYQQQADNYLTGPLKNGALEKVRQNGDVVRYNPSTGEFGVVSANGVIRTYYRPDPVMHGYPTNEDYFNAQ